MKNLIHDIVNLSSITSSFSECITNFLDRLVTRINFVYDIEKLNDVTSGRDLEDRVNVNDFPPSGPKANGKEIFPNFSSVQNSSKNSGTVQFRKKSFDLQSMQITF